MVEREIRSDEDILDVIYLIKKKKNLRIVGIAKASGVNRETMHRWKAKKIIPMVDSVIKILTTLNVEIVLSANNLGKKVLQRADIVNFICQTSKSKKLSLSKADKNIELRNVRIDNVLNVLSVLDAKMVLRTDELEEEQESEGDKTKEVETMDAEHGETESSELDMLILNSAEKALKNCNSLSEKMRLYKVLQAFI